MADFTADQIIGKSLVANKPVPLYRRVSTEQAPIYEVGAGKSVGVVYSYVMNGDNVWWMFYDANNRPYYTPHERGAFNLDVVRSQGAMTIEEKKKADEKKKKEQEGGFNPFSDVSTTADDLADNLKSAIKWVGGGLVAVLIFNTVLRK